MLGRVAALVALGVAVVALVVLLAGGGSDDYEVTATFAPAATTTLTVNVSGDESGNGGNVGGKRTVFIERGRDGTH